MAILSSGCTSSNHRYSAADPDYPRGSPAGRQPRVKLGLKLAGERRQNIRLELVTILALAVAMVGCATARDEAKGFRLAGNGDLHQGKAAFLEFGCNTCHEVRGASHIPSPTIQRVVLGGSVLKEPSDGYLVTAIINPAYHAARYPVAKDTGVHPRVPDYASRMTVQQLTDIVAYLKSRYALAPAAVPNEFP